MCDNTQQHIEIWNLVCCLVPLHWSKVVLKIVSPHAPNPRTKSGIAALCTLFILFCLERPVACFPVAYKHFYDFFSFAVVGRKHNCCLPLLAVNNVQILNDTIPHILSQVPATTLDMPDPQEALAWLAPWSCTLVKASTYIPAQQSSPLHSAASGPLAALLIRWDSDTASRFGGSIK